MAPVQTVAVLDQRPGRIQAYDLLQAEVEEVCHITAHVGAQRVTHAGGAVNAKTRIA